MDETRFETTSECIQRLRIRHKIPTDYKAYSDNVGNIWGVLSKLKEPKIVCEELTLSSTDVIITNRYGIIKGDYFIVIKDELNSVHMVRDYSYLFTNNLEKFYKEFFYKKPVEKKKIIYKPGFYKPVLTMFGYVLEKINLGENGKPVLNDDLFDILKGEIDSFRKKRKVYERMKIDYKRGILLMGEPGNGKTTFVKHLLNDLKKDVIGILCDKNNGGEIDFISDLAADDDYKNVLKILVMEDIDGMNKTNRSMLLNFLDGVTPIHNTIIISTTNFPDKLDIAIKNRPSRFDSVHHIGQPNAISRNLLLRRFFPKLKKEELKLAVKESKGFSGAYFKEIYILAELNDMTALESIKELKRRFQIFSDYGG